MRIGRGAPPPPYLRPYLDAARRHGGSFSTLLWTSPASQAARFSALCRLYNFSGKSIVDIGCGRADFVDYLLEREIIPNHYVGLEAVEPIARAAEAKQHPHCTIIRADFIKEPARMFAGADVAVFCGSLNTLSNEQFDQALHRAYDAATEAVVFNFLCSPKLAAAEFLTWHRIEQVHQTLKNFGADSRHIADYYDGDCTIIGRKNN